MTGGAAKASVIVRFVSVSLDVDDAFDSGLGQTLCERHVRGLGAGGDPELAEAHLARVPADAMRSSAAS